MTLLLAPAERYFPVPWARDTSNSFLVTENELGQFLEEAGFVIESWRDTTEIGCLYFERMVTRIEDTDRLPLGTHILLGDDFFEMARNQLRNLKERRIRLLLHLQNSRSVGFGPS